MINTKCDIEDEDFLKETKQHWQIEEDLIICIFASKMTQKKWNVIAEELKNRIQGSNRNGKQCRERWTNNLDPAIRKCVWN